MTKIHTETFGSGKPITLVHGWAMHSGIWRAFANALAKHYQVTLLDLPGHGSSENISPFTLETISQTLVDAAEDERSCWLGWSLGAEIVLEIARRFPERVNRLVLLAGTPCFVKKTDWPGMDEQVLENFSANLQQDSQMTLLRFLALQIKGLDDQKSALQNIIPLVSESPAPNQKILQEGLAILKETDLKDAFANLKIPVAVILGQLDTLIPAIIGEKMLALLPGMDLTIIDRAGHMPFLSHEDAVVKTVCDFMDQQ